MQEQQPDIHFRSVTKDNWHDLETLFEETGGPKYCWCMVWRAVGDERKNTKGKNRKKFLKKRVDTKTPVGILAYIENKHVGWCSIAPKITHRKLDDLKQDSHYKNIWSIVCFFIKKEFRNRGITNLLINQAVEYAKANNADEVEAYPVDEESPSYRFMGFVSTFAKHGFDEIGKAGNRRHVMRLVIKKNNNITVS